MARFQNKTGGPLRGRQRVKKIGMGSGSSVAKQKANRKRGKRS